jgi:glycosyltransferase involved in cell wall biosynthesis
MQHYYRESYGASAQFIAYGAPLVLEPKVDRLSELDLEQNHYHLVVARLVPENHVHIIIEGYRASSARWPLVVVGSSPYEQKYVEDIHAAAAADPRIRMLGAVWDQELLDTLYASALSYLHGHSVGGTNPSLLRAMGAGAAVAAFDVPFNREVLGPTGTFWSDADSVAREIESAERDPSAASIRGAAAQARAAGYYDWDEVCASYEELFLTMTATRGYRHPLGLTRPTAGE